jgi:hypothetical protein
VVFGYAPPARCLSTLICLASAPPSTATECASPSPRSPPANADLRPQPGVFTILQKDARHRSKKHDNAPMPFQERLTWEGVTEHAGGLPGYPESHGCVHLPCTFSQELFGITTLGSAVVVEGDAANHITTTDAACLLPWMCGAKKLLSST